MASWNCFFFLFLASQLRGRVAEYPERAVGGRRLPRRPLAEFLHIVEQISSVRLEISVNKCGELRRRMHDREGGGDGRNHRVGD